MGQKQKKLKDIKHQFNPVLLLPFETFWMDTKMKAILPQTKNRRRALKVGSDHCHSLGLQELSAELSRVYLNFGWWEMDSWGQTNIHNQQASRFTGAPSVSSNHMSGFKAQAKHYSTSGKGVEQWPYVELGAAAGGSIGEYFIRAWAKFFPNENIHISLKVGLYHMCMFINIAASLFGSRVMDIGNYFFSDPITCCYCSRLIVANAM